MTTQRGDTTKKRKHDDQTAAAANNQRQNDRQNCLSTIDLMRTGLRQNARIFHFHDPELIPLGLLLRMLRHQVIYDVHEDLPRAILYKEWIPPMRFR